MKLKLLIYFIISFLGISALSAQEYIRLESENNFKFKPNLELNYITSLANGEKISVQFLDYKHPFTSVYKNDSLVINTVLIQEGISSIRRNGEVIGVVLFKSNMCIINIHDTYWKIDYSKEQNTLEEISSNAGEVHPENMPWKKVIISTPLKTTTVYTHLDNIPVDLISVLFHYNIKNKVFFSYPSIGLVSIAVPLLLLIYL